MFEVYDLELHLFTQHVANVYNTAHSLNTKDCLDSGYQLFLATESPLPLHSKPGFPFQFLTPTKDHKVAFQQLNSFCQTENQ